MNNKLAAKKNEKKKEIKIINIIGYWIRELVYITFVP
jgi:hypothetical protein